METSGRCTMWFLGIVFGVIVGSWMSTDACANELDDTYIHQDEGIVIRIDNKTGQTHLYLSDEDSELLISIDGNDDIVIPEDLIAD